MRRKTPESYTVLIARPGKAPLVFSMRPTLVVGLLALSLVGVISIVYFYWQRNNLLLKEAAQFLERLKVIETEVQYLRKRAGLPEFQAKSSVAEVPGYQGGGQSLDPSFLLKGASAKLTLLSEDLLQVKPALEDALAFEAAQPNGLPLKIATSITSAFGMRPSPFGSAYEFHDGVDFAGDHGTPIHVTAPGVVITADFSEGYGYHVIVEHRYGYRTLYAHMSKMEVRQGIQVERGQVIGYIGSTGRSSGPHLHYSIYYHDQVVDPRQHLEFSYSTSP